MKNIKIIVNIENMNNIHHPFNKNTLNPTLVSFLQEECIGKPKKANIDIHIFSKQSLEDLQKEQIRNLIHKHFIEERKELKMKKEMTHIFYVSLLILGILFLLISLLILQEILKEIFLILGWIAIWEAVENFIFENSKETLKYHRYKKLASARIYFKEDSV